MRQEKHGERTVRGGLGAWVVLLREITQEQQVRGEGGLGFGQASAEVPADIGGGGAQCWLCELGCCAS